LTLVPRTGSAEGAWAADGAVSLALCRRIRPRYAPLAVRLAVVGRVLASRTPCALISLSQVREGTRGARDAVGLRGTVLVLALRTRLA